MEFLTLIQSFTCCNRIHTPTRVTSTSSTLLDPCVTNFQLDDIPSEIIIPGMSDHMPTFCILPKIKKANNKPVSRMYRTYQRKHGVNSMPHCSNTTGENVLCERNPEINIFYEIPKNNEASFPLRLKRVNRKIEKPWITQKLFHRIKYKTKKYSFLICCNSRRHHFI